MWQPDICIYHFPCDDGFGAAWAVWKRWGDAVEFRPTNYGQPVPDEGIDGKRVLIADFSFKPDVLAGMAERAQQIVLLDHHKTAEADLEGFPRMSRGTCHQEDVMFPMNGDNIVVEFDMERSGAAMTWGFCHPAAPPPELIKYIEDRDLWRMKFPETRPLSLLLRSHRYDFVVWDEIMCGFGSGDDSILREAYAIERFYDRKLAELIPNAVRWMEIGGATVPVLNVPWAFASDAGHELLKECPDAPFAAAYFDNGSGRTFSLRSENHRSDVSEIARQYGGGGHRNAAGFRVPA